MRLQDIGRHQRGDQARDQQREEHRRGDRQAELLEVLAGDASHEADRKEHGDDGGGGRHHRQTDLVRRIERRLETRLAHAHVTHDILDLDDRVIHQHTGHQRQGQHADRIEGEIHRVHEREGRDRRQRDGERGDRGRAPVAQEHQHDEHCEHRAFDHRRERRAIALTGVLHGSEHADDADIGVLGLDDGDLGLDAIERRHIRGTARLRDAEIYGGSAVEPLDGPAFRHRVAHLRKVRQTHQGAARHAHLGRAEFERSVCRAEHADRLLAARHLRPSARRVEVQQAQLLVHLDRGHAERLHPRWIELDADLPVLTPAAGHLRDARKRQQPLADRVVHEPTQLFGGAPGGADRVVRDRPAFDIDPRDLRFVDALGQLGADLADGITDIAEGAVDRRPDLELHRGEGAALRRAGADGAHPGHAAHGTLDLLRDLRLDLRRCRTGLGHLDDDERERDVGIEVDRQAHETHDPEYREHHESDDRQRGVADRPRGHVLHGATRTCSPSRR